MILYHSLTDSGFSLRSDGPRLIVSPASRLTDEQRTAIKEQKEELLLIVRLGEITEPTEAENEIWDDDRLIDWREYRRLWEALV